MNQEILTLLPYTNFGIEVLELIWLTKYKISGNTSKKIIRWMLIKMLIRMKYNLLKMIYQSFHIFTCK